MLRSWWVAAVVLCVIPGALNADTITLTNFPIEIVFDARNERVAEKVREVCQREIEPLAQQLGLGAMVPIRIDVVHDMRPYRHALTSQLPVWGVAFALLNEQVIVVDVQKATRQYNALDKVIPHELSHLLLAQRIGRVQCPVWFLEGLAQWQAGEWTILDNWQLMNAVWSNAAPRLWHLMNGYPAGEESARAAYRVSYSAFVDAFGDRSDELPAFLGAVAATGFEVAFAQYVGEDLGSWMVAFHQRLDSRYQSRLLFFQSGPLFSVAAVLFLIIGLSAWIRKRRRMKALEREERGMWVDDGSGPGV